MFDFSKCRYIEEKMTIYTFTTFYYNRLLIKKRYKQLDNNAKRFYRWYVYANQHMRDMFKDAVWEYLNDDKTDEELERLLPYDSDKSKKY